MIDGVWSFRLGEPDPVSVHFEMIGHGETPESFTVESGAMLLHATIDTSKVESFSIGKLKKASTGRRLPIDDLSFFLFYMHCSALDTPLCAGGLQPRHTVESTVFLSKQILICFNQNRIFFLRSNNHYN